MVLTKNVPYLALSRLSAVQELCLRVEHVNQLIEIILATQPPGEQTREI